MRFFLSFVIIFSCFPAWSSCFQNCGVKSDVWTSKMLLDFTNEGVSENINFEGSASLRNGFKDHGVTLALKSKDEPVRSGETSFRFELRHGDCGKNPGWNDCAKNRERHEISQRNDIRSEKWITTSLFVPEDINMYSIQSGNTITGATSISQFHQHQITESAIDKFSPPFMFNLEASGYTVRNFILATHNQRPVLISREDLLGKWVDILFHINPTSDHHGFLRIYVNGSSEPAYTYDGAFTATNQALYMKIGLYRFGIPDDFKTPTQVVYFDNIFMENRCDDIPSELGFDCKAIEQTEIALNKTRSPLMMACDDGVEICPVRYGRTKDQITDRLTCLFDGLDGVSTVATKEQIAQFAEAMADWDDFTMKPGDYYWATFSPETIDAHGEEMVATMNLLSPEAEKFVCSK